MERMVSKVGGAPFGRSRSALLPLGLVNDQKMARDPRLSPVRYCQRFFVDLFITALQKRVLCDCNFVLYVMSSSCTRLSNISRNIWTIFNLNFICPRLFRRIIREKYHLLQNCVRLSNALQCGHVAKSTYKCQR